MSKKVYPSTIAPRLTIRMNKQMRRKIKQIAKKEGRTMTTQVVQMLDKAISEYESRAA